jgi:hypothetical protein
MNRNGLKGLLRQASSPSGRQVDSSTGKFAKLVVAETVVFVSKNHHLNRPIHLGIGPRFTRTRLLYPLFALRRHSPGAIRTLLRKARIRHV